MIIRNVMGSLVQPSGQEAKRTQSASVNSGIRCATANFISMPAPGDAYNRLLASAPYGAAGFLNLSQSGERPDW